MARFKAALQAGEIDETNEVYIAEIASLWRDGQYYPYVYLDDYLKKGEAIDFANDLTGVQEATAEEFTFRPSAGFRSIRDESAVIRRIKGNTSVWAQYVKNGDFAEGTRYFSMINSTLSDNGDGSITITHKLDNSCGVSTFFDTHIPRGHKILAVADYQRDSASSSRTLLYLRRNGGGFDSRIIPEFGYGRRRVDYAIITATDDITGFYFYPFFDSPAGTQCVIYTMAVYDLTAIYGAGNEPTTLDEFRELYPDSYYRYCVPEVRAMRATGVETIGFNAFNGEYAEVLGGLRYCISGTVTNMGFSDSIDGEITQITIPEEGGIYTPSRRGYIYAEGSDICIHLVHSGVCNGEHHDYVRNVRLLPDIATYFPDGMHGIGDVYDEINEENAVKRFGVVDLGTLWWYESDTKAGMRRFGSNGISELAEWPSANNVLANIVCVKYDRGTADDTYLDIHCIAIGRTGSIFIYDPNYNTTGSLADFVASLQGVLLYYELAEPVVTPITEPLQLDYKVADFGTEKMLSDLPSSPFRADIVYQFNAEGRIRDNSRNIERLEEKVKNMATIEDIPTEIATATQRKVMSGAETVLSLLPNILYDYSMGSLGSLALPPLSTGNLAYDDVWMVRAGLISSTSLTIPFDVVWRDGIAPSFNEWCTIDLTFRKNANGERILGEWKIYK